VFREGHETPRIGDVESAAPGRKGVLEKINDALRVPIQRKPSPMEMGLGFVPMKGRGKKSVGGRSGMGAFGGGWGS